MSPSAQRVPAVGRLPAIADVVPGAPTATYDFYSGETLTALVTTLGTQVRQPLKVTVSLKTMAGEEKLSLASQPDSPGLKSVEPLRLLTVPIPLSDIPAGSYVLEFEVQSNDRRSARSALAITVK